MPPFQVVAMDLITGLPMQRGLDAILTIVDHGCSRAAIFLPCSIHISGAGVTQLYLNHIYLWYGLPRKIISNRDLRFTSHFGKALTKQLRDPTKPIHCLTPLNGWTFRVEEPMGRAIPETGNWGSTRRLARLAGNSHCSL